MGLLTRVDHVDIVFDGDLDNLVDGKIGLDRRVLAAPTNFIGLIRLWNFSGWLVGNSEMEVDG